MRRVEVEDGFTPDDLDFIATELERSTTTTPTTQRSWSARPFAQAAGGAIGGTLGGLATANPLGAVGGAGLGAGIGGQAYDAAKQLFAGNVAGPTSMGQLGQEARQIGGDVIEGTMGEMGGQVVGKGLQAAAGALMSRRAGKDAARATLRGQAARSGIPLAASDITQSKTVRQIENYPGYFAIGGGRVTQFREGQATAARDAVANVAGRLSDTQADAMTAGLKAQGGTKAVVQGWRQQSARLFNEIEQLAGPEPVVPTTKLRAMARSILERTAPTPMGAPAIAGDIVEGLTSVPLREVIENERIPFAVARQIEAELGERAFRGAAPVGNLRQGELKALYAAVRGDIDDFLTSPAGADVAPALAQAKQVYATGKQLFNDSAKRIVLGGRTRPLAPEQVIDRAFRPGNISDTLDFKLLVDDDTYAQATQAWLSRLTEKATKDGVFSPERFLTQLAPYEKSGQLQVILEPGAAADLADAAASMRAMVSSNRLAANPSGTGQALMSGGQLSGMASIPYFLSQGQYGPAVGAGAAMLTPAAVGRFVTSEGGRRMLSESMVPNLGQLLGPEGLRPLTQWLGAQ